MKNIAILKTNRYEYDAKLAADRSITIREFIDLLKENFYDLDTKIVFSNDGGYTYGYVTENTIDEIEVEED